MNVPTGTNKRNMAKVGYRWSDKTVILLEIMFFFLYTFLYPFQFLGISYSKVMDNNDAKKCVAQRSFPYYPHCLKFFLENPRSRTLCVFFHLSFLCREKGTLYLFSQPRPRLMRYKNCVAYIDNITFLLIQRISNAKWYFSTRCEINTKEKTSTRTKIIACNRQNSSPLVFFLPSIYW